MSKILLDEDDLSWLIKNATKNCLSGESEGYSVMYLLEKYGDQMSTLWLQRIYNDLEVVDSELWYVLEELTKRIARKN